jgi:DNA helicase HerA-like ATPase
VSELYIGKHLDPNGMRGELSRHKLSDLITHTFICGGSGSGKTVMGKAIIEEAALKGVPSIIVDLKGDLSSLALAFGELAAPAVAPWVEVEDKSTLGRAALAEAKIGRAHV